MKIKTDTIIRTAVLLLALLNQILTACGKSPLPIADETLKEALSLCLTIGASVWNWWKNNSFTAAAKTADEFLKEIKEIKANGKNIY